MVQCLNYLAVQLVQDLSRFQYAILVNDLVQGVMSYDRHEGTRYTMTRAIYRRKEFFAICRGKPIEISTYNIFGFEKDKSFRERGFRGQNGKLDPLCIPDTVCNIFILLGQLLFLGHHLGSPDTHLIFQHPVFADKGPFPHLDVEKDNQSDGYNAANDEPCRKIK